MIEYYGWLRIRYDPNELVQQNVDDLYQNVTKAIDNLQLYNRLIQAKWINGRFIVVVAGSNNHKANTWEDILSFFELIAKLASGSYGLLYVLDDEDMHGHDNEFVVYRVAKGRFEIQNDQLLSPCSQMIFSD